MVISEDLLFSHGAVSCYYNASEYIFREGTVSKFYFQVKSGVVKINNYTDTGNEFIHGFPFEGHCVGESYLFTDLPYGINAITVTQCEIIKIEKEKFLTMVSTIPTLLLNINKYTAERVHFRYLISSLLPETRPESRITKLLEHIKKYFGYTDQYSFMVPYTRSQIAALIGLRVETVIRAIKKMEAEDKLLIKGSKIFYQFLFLYCL